MIKKGDFIKIDFTGFIKDTNEVFDTSIKSVADNAGLDTQNAIFEPVIICVGENFILPKLESMLIGKDIGKFTFDIEAENAFGKKQANMLKVFNTNFFLKNEIMPQPGLQVNIDGRLGTIRSVTGGRTIVDFNHPLAGKDLRYEIEVKSFVTDTNEKLKAVLAHMSKLDRSVFKTDFREGKAVVNITTQMPQEVEKILEKKIKELIPEIKEISFIISEEKRDDKKDGEG